MSGIETIPLRIPETWDPAWFRVFIRDVLSKADARNATGNGVTITGTPDKPATITAAPVSGITNAQLAQMPANTIKANLTGAAASPADATASSVATAVQSYVTISESQVTNLTTDLAALASTASVNSGLALKANLSGGNSFSGIQTFNTGTTYNGSTGTSVFAVIPEINGSVNGDVTFQGSDAGGYSAALWGANAYVDSAGVWQRKNASLGGILVEMYGGITTTDHGAFAITGFTTNHGNKILFQCDDNGIKASGPTGTIQLGSAPTTIAFPGLYSFTAKPTLATTSPALAINSTGSVGTSIWAKESSSGSTWASVKTGSDENTLTFNNGVNVKTGTGAPGGVVTGNPGDMYLNKSGGAGTTLYVKESGTNTNTGWVGK